MNPHPFYEDKRPRSAVASRGQIADCICWLPSRFTGGCYCCDRVEKCKTPEAIEGRKQAAHCAVMVQEEKIRHAQSKLKEARQTLRERM